MDKSTQHIARALITTIASFIGIIAVIMVGSMIGGAIEARIGSPVVSWEMAPAALMIFAIPAGILVANICSLTRKWSYGLTLGLVIQGLVFMGIDFLLLGGGSSNPFAVRCWFFAVGTCAGGMAGAIGGVIGQAQANRNHAPTRAPSSQ